jgi:hypothetical protein
MIMPITEAKVGRQQFNSLGPRNSMETSLLFLFFVCYFFFFVFLLVMSRKLKTNIVTKRKLKKNCSMKSIDLRTV